MKRAGFTLVELLVVMSIILLITVMTMSAWNFTLESERVGNGARQVQSYLEGAKSRAVYEKEPRGVRFLLDQTRDATTERRAVKSMVYIQPTGSWSEGGIFITRPDLDKDNVADFDEARFVRGLRTGWYSLMQRGLIRNMQTRIRIPAGPDGTWYTVATENPANPNQKFLTSTDELLYLVTEYVTAPNTSAGSVIAVTPTPPSYEIELPWSPVPNSEPVVLPSGTVIDLLLSDAPPYWINSATGRFYAEMDLHFGPRGTMIGPAAALGNIHFWIGRQEDSDLSATRPPLHPETGDKVLVSIRTQTGVTGSHPVDIVDADGDQIPDDPYRYAEIGEVLR